MTNQIGLSCFFYHLDEDYTFSEFELTLLTTAVLILTFPRPSGNRLLFFFMCKIAIQQFMASIRIAVHLCKQAYHMSKYATSQRFQIFKFMSSFLFFWLLLYFLLNDFFLIFWYTFDISIAFYVTVHYTQDIDKAVLSKECLGSLSESMYCNDGLI